MNICVYGASSDAIDPRFLAAGEALGREMARRGHGLIFGGGGHGLMGAVARGMTQGGGSITGIAPRFFNVDGVLYDGCTEFLYTETMRERKALMESKADAFVMTPGGIGTYEEFFEILTLRQLGQHHRRQLDKPPLSQQADRQRKQPQQKRVQCSRQKPQRDAPALLAALQLGLQQVVCPG